MRNCHRKERFLIHKHKQKFGNRYIYIYSNTDSDWYSTLYDTDAESAEFGTEEETVSGTYRYNDTEMGTRNSEYSE